MLKCCGIKKEKDLCFVCNVELDEKLCIKCSIKKTSKKNSESLYLNDKAKTDQILLFENVNNISNEDNLFSFNTSEKCVYCGNKLFPKVSNENINKYNKNIFYHCKNCTVSFKPFIRDSDLILKPVVQTNNYSS